MPGFLRLVSPFHSGKKAFPIDDSKTQSVKTKKSFFCYISAPNVVPENVEASATGNSTILVKWSPVNHSCIKGFRGYTIKYSLHFSSTPRFEYLDSSIHNKTLTDLKIFAFYKIQVATRTTQEGNYSDPRDVRTKEGGNIIPFSVTSRDVIRCHAMSLHVIALTKD